jgi:hypothetical protein
MNDRKTALPLASRLPVGVVAGLLVALTVAVYWPALNAGFVGDDFMILHRLRALSGPADVLRFFGGEYFEYYRPLGFVSHAVDWAIAGQNPRQFHATNLLLHTINSLLVLLIGRALAPNSLTGPVAALLFALHASNHEAVVWMSARFDVLATCFSLAAIGWMVRGGPGGSWVPALLFFPAVLSKESAVALPIAAAAWSTFGRRSTATATATVAAVAPWLLALAAYSAFRSLAGGVSPIGGASRLPKLVALGVGVIAMVLLADERWVRVGQWLRDRPRRVMALGAATLVAMMLAAAFSQGRAGHLAREKLSVAGFALFYLTSPVLGAETAFSDPAADISWMSGAVALLVAGMLVGGLRRPLLEDGRMWFLAAFLAASLLPISALTEGKRYLYLPSAAFALIIGLWVAELRGRAKVAGALVVGVVLVVSAVQISAKTRDWVWAGRMTAEGARLVDSALAPQCGTGQVVFLTSPVGIRGVYSHFYYETFEVPRGCMPEVFQVLVRVMHVDTPVDVRWNGPRQIVLTTPAYAGNFVLSRDLREFTTPLRAGDRVAIETLLGELRAEPIGAGVNLTLTVSPDVQRDRIHFFYYSDGRVLPLGSPQ